MQIKWSEQSREDLHSILAYAGETFGKTAASAALTDIRSTAETLSNFPMAGKKFVVDKELNITYRTMATKMNQIVYYIDGEDLNIVTVWANRRDIGKLKKQLSNKRIQ